MEDLKLFSFGQSDHIEALKKKFEALKKKINENKALSELEKTSEIGKLEEAFEKEKKNSKNNLY